MQEPGHGKYTQKLLIITILLMHQLSYVRSGIGCLPLDYVCRGKKKKERKIQATLKNTWSQDLYKSYLDGNYLQEMSLWSVSTINLPAL